MISVVRVITFRKALRALLHILGKHRLQDCAVHYVERNNSHYIPRSANEACVSLFGIATLVGGTFYSQNLTLAPSKRNEKIK